MLQPGKGRHWQWGERQQGLCISWTAARNPQKYPTSVAGRCSRLESGRAGGWFRLRSGTKAAIRSYSQRPTWVYSVQHQQFSWHRSERPIGAARTWHRVRGYSLTPRRPLAASLALQLGLGCPLSLWMISWSWAGKHGLLTLLQILSSIWNKISSNPSLIIKIKIIKWDLQVKTHKIPL